MQKNLLKPNSSRKKYQNLVNNINSFENNFKTLSISELRAQNFKLQKQAKDDESLNSLIIESFALTRETSSRILGLRHYDVQLIGGLVLNSQKIAEMKTGEGKTLVATLPACLNALTGKGVHIVSVNSYLIGRDQVSMSRIYQVLGFNTGLVQDEMSAPDRIKNYNADITYVTNYTLTFDYLRDNLVLNLKEMVLRPFNYCIIDEIDSVLIDEAQVPLILSEPIETAVEKYLIASEISNYLKPDLHYIVDEKNQNIVLKDTGNREIEKILQIQNLYDLSDPWIPYIINAIKAKTLFTKNIEYIIQDDRIVIVDEFTGRSMSDRRWSEGLHQAVEAKEKLPIRQNSETKAGITYQNFFLLYPKLSGMTGTGKTAEIEFEKIYNLCVEEIPTAQPNLRKDLPDLIYKDQFSKWNAIAKNCNKISSIGQPILIGTTTVEKSEMLAQLLDEYQLFYQLLNAKPENVRRESEIVAQAGKKSAVTIATNMAGRGTDIILGGKIDFQTQKELYDILTLSKSFIRSKKRDIFQFILKNEFNYNSQMFFSVLMSLITDKNFLKMSDFDVLQMLIEDEIILIPSTFNQYSIKFLNQTLKAYCQKRQNQDHKIVKNLGGLYIFGTERNNSRRIDNQLRGRCARQGDPGTSRFFLSLDDNLLRLFGSPRIQTFMQKQMLDNSPLESKFLNKSLDSAQEQVEERAYQQRKNLFNYDDTLNRQRKVIYFERNLILKNVLNEENLLAYGEQVISDILLELKKRKISKLDIETIQLIEDLCIINLPLKYIQNSKFLFEQVSFSELKPYLFNEFWLTYQSKKKQFEVYLQDSSTLFERTIFLINIDKIWCEHLKKMTLLQESVGWRGYGQKNPLYEYKKDAFYIFKYHTEVIRQLVVHDLLRSSIL